jgi:hypothetical protein
MKPITLFIFKGLPRREAAVAGESATDGVGRKIGIIPSGFQQPVVLQTGRSWFHDHTQVGVVFGEAATKICCLDSVEEAEEAPVAVLVFNTLQV